ncbi:MAG: leucine-rich repeat domain-containing protein, partial [Ureaplasma sp.]|nr:leucine-rich repeat domain-containing protein [Ureaplasma sp.]
NNISSYLSNQIYDLVKNINTVNNGNLEQYIAEPTFSSNSINISLKSNVGFYKFKTSSFTNVSITSNQISLNSITLFTPPTPSPVNWFTWDKTKITGLSNLGINANSREIVIPDICTGLSYDAFAKNTNITSVNMSFSKITSLEGSGGSSSGPFNSCTNLTKIIWPKNLSIIGNYTFYNCSKLVFNEFPSTLNSIGWSSFSGCTSLSEITLPDNLSEIRNYAFSGTGIIDITIKNNLSTLGEYIFYNCKKLKTAKIESTKISILSGHIFQNCSNLTSVSISSSIYNIDQYAFDGCSSLRTINIPSSITIFNNYAFRNCFSLVSLEIPSKLSLIGNYCFAGCTSLSEITLPNTLNFIGDYAFNNMDNSSINVVIYVYSNDLETQLRNSRFSGTIINFA